MASLAGMTSAIMNPLHKEELDGVRAANMLNGTDPDCAAWLRANRPTEDVQGGRARRTNRRRRTNA
jgi:5-methyltetrahydrofolate--homocysteine methyltransferase